MLRNFRTYIIAVDFYRLTRTLKLPSHLKQQLARAASSVALNLAEARGKSSVADQTRFFQIALGSVRECQAIFELADHATHPVADRLDHLAASLYRLIKNARRG